MLDILKKYKRKYSQTKLLRRLPKSLKNIGLKTIYSILLMFNAYRREETPSWAKNIILGVIGYFLSPIDGIPDLTPFVGFTDDISVIGFGLVSIACYINEDVRKRSKKQLHDFFGNYDEAELSEIDAKL